MKKKTKVKKFQRKIKNIEPKIWLISILIFAMFLRLYFFIGLNWSDDPYYVDLANQIIHGTMYISSPHSTRALIIYPLAMSFALFGISEFSAVLYPLICSLAGIVVIFYLGKKIVNEKIGLLSAFLLAVFPLDVNYATWIMGEAPLALFLSLSVLFFIKANENSKKSKNIFYILAGIFTGFGYLVKVSGAITLIFFSVYFIYQFLRTRKIQKWPIFVLLGFLTVLTLEGTFYFYKTHNFLQRYYSEVYYFGEKQRLTNELVTDLNFYPNIMFNIRNIFSDYSYFGPFYLFVILSILYFLIKREKKSYLLIIWFLSLFLYMQYGTMSIKEYIPMHRLDRHLIVLSTPAILIFSYFLMDICKYKNLKPIALFMAIFLVLMFLTHINNITYLQRGSTKDTKLIFDFLKDKDIPIYSDGGTVGHLNFYFGFQKRNSLRTIEWLTNCDEIHDAFVVVNATRAWFELHPFMENIPKCIINPPNDWKAVKVIESNFREYPYNLYNPVIYYVP
jgi:4-amino-4-deoxy-L-arabinose transferase-like glycosyltransferase